MGEISPLTTGQSWTEIFTYQSVSPTEEDGTAGSGLSNEVILHITIGVFGVIGNGFVLVVLLNSREMRKNITNIFIFNQSVIDLITSLFLIVNFPTTANVSPQLAGERGEVYCRLWYSQLFFWCSICTSTYNLVAITIHRYIEVVHPIKYKNKFTKSRAYQMIVLVYIWGFGYSMLFIISTMRVVKGECMAVWHQPILEKKLNHVI